MLLLVTVQTQELPVAAINRIVVVVVIPVMDSELANVLAAELARALRTHGRKQLQRAGSIAPSRSALARRASATSLCRSSSGAALSGMVAPVTLMDVGNVARDLGSVRPSSAA